MSSGPRWVAVVAIGFALGPVAGPAAAHQATSTSSEVSVLEGGLVRYHLSFATRGASAPPLHEALGTPEDHEPSDEELAESRHRLTSYLMQRVRVRATSGLSCATERAQLDIGGGTRRPVTLRFDARCPASDRALIEYHLFFEQDHLHNGWISLNEPGGRVEDVFKSARRQRRIALGSRDRSVGDPVLHGLRRASRPLGVIVVIAGAVLLTLRPGAARRRAARRRRA